MSPTPSSLWPSVLLVCCATLAFSQDAQPTFNPDLPYIIVDKDDQAVDASILRKRPLLLVGGILFTKPQDPPSHLEHVQKLHSELNSLLDTEPGKKLVIVSVIFHSDNTKEARKKAGITWPSIVSPPWTGQMTPDFAAWDEMRQFLLDNGSPTMGSERILFFDADDSVTVMSFRDVIELVKEKLGISD
jgi:hypothetical protein